MDWDTGTKTIFGEYQLADETYYTLLMKLKRKKFADVPESLKKNIIEYYYNRDPSSNYGIHSHKGKKITRALEDMKAQVT
jgi:hypothetical protein